MKLIIQIMFNLFLALDQLLNTLLLGHPDETLSSRLGRTRNNERYFFIKWARLFVNTLFFFDTTTKMIPWETRKVYHCEKSIMPLEQENFRKFIDYEVWSWNK